jgi:hypothetical protein
VDGPVRGRHVRAAASHRRWDTTELVDVEVEQVAGVIALRAAWVSGPVRNRAPVTGPDRAAVARGGGVVAAQYAADGRGIGAEPGGEPDRSSAVCGTQGQDLCLVVDAEAGRAGVGPAGAVQQAGFAFGLVAANPAVGGLAGDAELGRDVCDGAVLGALDQQQA